MAEHTFTLNTPSVSPLLGFCLTVARCGVCTWARLCTLHATAWALLRPVALAPRPLIEAR